MRAPDAPLLSALRVYVFLGSFLLFTLEPLTGRLLLPSFGGAFHVWTTTLMFFQLALLAGYLWSHGVAPHLGRAHLVLLALPTLLLPLHPPAAPETPDVFAVLRALAVSVGLLGVALSTTGVVAQAVLSRAQIASERDTYGLYALSNAGSFAALVLDAWVLGPRLGLHAQSRVWTTLYVAYVLSATFALRATRPAPPTPTARTPLRLSWVLLSLWPSVLLSAVTNKLTLDAGPVPLLWTLPLGIYLLTFVLAFDARDRVPASLRRLWPYVALVGLYLSAGGDLGSPALQALALLVLLAVLCLAAHAELFARRPPPEQLTTYYLAVALGGVLGGAFVALVAPRAFSELHELPVALVGLLTTVAVLRRAELSAWVRTAERPALAITLALPAVIVLKLWLGAHAQGANAPRTLAVARSPYGVYHVLERATELGPVRELVSGTTRHGRQRVESPEPLSYYHREGSLGDVFATLTAPRGQRSVAVVGLGVGAAAAHLDAGDTMTFFEIDPLVEDLARQWFTFLARGASSVTVRTGDARTALARRPERFDLLVLDAFSGDAIPTHLITREALALDLSHVREDGLLVVHASNRFHDLRPVLAASTRALGLQGRWHRRLTDLRPGEDPSLYLAFARRPELLRGLDARGWRDLREIPAGDLWTDDHADAVGLFLRGLRASFVR